VGALLQEPRLVRDQDPVRVAELGQHIVADVVTHRVGVPHRRPQQPLHRIRRGVPGLLGQPPAVLALHGRQQPEHEIPRRTPRLDPRESARDARHRLIEHRPPAGRIYAVASGHRPIYSIVHNRR
jgi:hypothetical protein